MLCDSSDTFQKAVSARASGCAYRKYHRGRIATESTTSRSIFWGRVAPTEEACNIVKWTRSKSLKEQTEFSVGTGLALAQALLYRPPRRVGRTGSFGSPPDFFPQNSWYKLRPLPASCRRSTTCRYRVGVLRIRFSSSTQRPGGVHPRQYVVALVA